MGRSCNDGGPRSAVRPSVVAWLMSSAVIRGIAPGKAGARRALRQRIHGRPLRDHEHVARPGRPAGIVSDWTPFRFRVAVIRELASSPALLSATTCRKMHRIDDCVQIFPSQESVGRRRGFRDLEFCGGNSSSCGGFVGFFRREMHTIVNPMQKNRAERHSMSESGALASRGAVRIGQRMGRVHGACDAKGLT